MLCTCTISVYFLAWTDPYKNTNADTLWSYGTVQCTFLKKKKKKKKISTYTDNLCHSDQIWELPNIIVDNIQGCEWPKLQNAEKRGQT